MLDCGASEVMRVETKVSHDVNIRVAFCSRQQELQVRQLQPA